MSKKLANERYFYMKDVECTITISYTTRKELLELLDNILNNCYDTYEYMENEGACFHIMYKDGSEDVIDMFYNGHKIKKINIASIVYTDATENLVWGNFEVSEYGSVIASLTEKIDNTNVVEVNRAYMFEPLVVKNAETVQGVGKSMFAYVKDKQTKEHKIIRSNYYRKSDFIRDLHNNGYAVCYVCLDTDAEIEKASQKYHDRLDAQRIMQAVKREHYTKVENSEQVEINENTNTIDNNISELTNSVIELDKLKKSALRIKINNLMCFTYLLTQAICKFLQNCNKVPNSINGFIHCMKFNFLGIVFNIQVIDGKITYVNFGRLSMVVNNRCNYKAYDYVLDCYMYFSNIYYNIGRFIINAYRHIHSNTYRKISTQHSLIKMFCGSYAENHS